MIIIAYKNWNEKLIDLKIDEDWEVFVITKEFFQNLYGPTLIKLAQFFYNPWIEKKDTLTIENRKKKKDTNKKKKKKKTK